jgi:hypothetical protein
MLFVILVDFILKLRDMPVKIVRLLCSRFVASALVCNDVAGSHGVEDIGGPANSRWQNYPKDCSCWASCLMMEEGYTCMN